MLEEILEEGLAALVPVYDGGNITQVLRYDGSKVAIRRTCRTVLRNVARYYGVDLTATREIYRKLVNKKHLVPLPFSTGLILIPIRMREKPLGENDGTLGYVNLKQVVGIESIEGGTKISLLNGGAVKVFVSEGTVREYVKDAQLVEKMFLRRQLPEVVCEASDRGIMLGPYLSKLFLDILK